MKAGTTALRPAWRRPGPAAALTTLVVLLAAAACAPGAQRQSTAIAGATAAPSTTLSASAAGGLNTPAMPNMTPLAVSTDMLAGQVLVRSQKLVGTDVTGQDANAIGPLIDLLFADNGQIRYALLAPSSREATHPVAVAWDEFYANPNLQQLVFTGRAADLDQAPAVDLASIPADAVFIETQGTRLPKELDGLFRATRLGGVRLTNTTNADLGRVMDLLFDVGAGQLDYVLVDAAAVRAGAPGVVGVPWARFDITRQQMVLVSDFSLRSNVDERMLRAAPAIDLEQLPTWIQTSQSDLPGQLFAFWQNAG